MFCQQREIVKKQKSCPKCSNDKNMAKIYQEVSKSTINLKPVKEVAVQNVTRTKSVCAQYQEDFIKRKYQPSINR